MSDRERSAGPARHAPVEQRESIATLLTSSRTEAELVANIETIVDQVVRAEQSGIYLFDAVTQRLRLVHARGLNEVERQSAEESAMARHPARVFRSCIPLVVEGTAMEPDEDWCGSAVGRGAVVNPLHGRST